eukprot:scpid93759/ scgid34545/ 
MEVIPKPVHFTYRLVLVESAREGQRHPEIFTRVGDLDVEHQDLQKGALGLEWSLPYDIGNDKVTVKLTCLDDKYGTSTRSQYDSVNGVAIVLVRDTPGSLSQADTALSLADKHAHTPGCMKFLLCTRRDPDSAMQVTRDTIEDHFRSRKSLSDRYYITADVLEDLEDALRRIAEQLHHQFNEGRSTQPPGEKTPLFHGQDTLGPTSRDDPPHPAPAGKCCKCCPYCLIL